MVKARRTISKKVKVSTLTFKMGDEGERVLTDKINLVVSTSRDILNSKHALSIWESDLLDNHHIERTQNLLYNHALNTK